MFGKRICFSLIATSMIIGIFDTIGNEKSLLKSVHATTANNNNKKDLLKRRARADLSTFF